MYSNGWCELWSYFEGVSEMLTQISAEAFLYALYSVTQTHTVGSPRGPDSVTCPTLKTISRGSEEMPMNGCCFCVELCEVNGSLKYLFSLQWLQICYKQGFPKLKHRFKKSCWLFEFIDWILLEYSVSEINFTNFHVSFSILSVST